MFDLFDLCVCVCVCIGLLLLFCGGLHVVWAIYQVLGYETSYMFRDELNRLNKENAHLADKIFNNVVFSKRMGLVLTVVMWYIGMMLGSFVAAWYLVPVVQKRNIYVSIHTKVHTLLPIIPNRNDFYIDFSVLFFFFLFFLFHTQYVSALVMFASGCLFYSVDAADSSWQTLLTIGRFVAGIAQGLVYVTIITQATENAAKDFRRILFSIIGGTIGFSIFFASTFLIYVPSPVFDDDAKGNEAENSEKTAAGIISFTSIFLSFVSVILSYFFAHETVPFLLYHNYREEEAQFTLAKLLGEDSDSELVFKEFLAIKEACIQDYAQFQENKIFKSVHRGLLSIALSARLAAIHSFNIPTIVLFVKLLQSIVLNSATEKQDEMILISVGKNETIEIIDSHTSIRKMINKYNHTLTTFLFTWFGFGLVIMLCGNYFNWKRGFHFVTFLAGISIVISVILVFIGFIPKGIAFIAAFFLLIYFQFLTLPIDVLGLTYLGECFPASTRIRSIGFITMVECAFNIVLVTLNFRQYQNEPEFIPMGLILSICGYKLFTTVPNTNGFSLAAAKQAYIDATAGKRWWQF